MTLPNGSRRPRFADDDLPGSWPGPWLLARWAAIGTLSAVGFGLALGLLMGAPTGRIDSAIGGSAVGLLGGPFFGVAAGFLRRFVSPKMGGWARRVRAFAAAGAVIFALVPFGIGSLRRREILPFDLGGLVFFAGTGAAFGVIAGAAIVGRARDERRSKGDAGPPVDEFGIEDEDSRRPDPMG